MQWIQNLSSRSSDRLVTLYYNRYYSADSACGGSRTCQADLQTGWLLCIIIVIIVLTQCGGSRTRQADLQTGWLLCIIIVIIVLTQCGGSRTRQADLQTGWLLCIICNLGLTSFGMNCIIMKT